MERDIFLGILVATILASSQIATANVFATPADDDVYNAFRNLSEEEREIWFKNYGDNRPAINPDFAPDEDCNIAYEIKCIPGSEQSCFDLEGYHNGEDNVCSPIKCQEGYHSEDDDETGLCYDNDFGCRYEGLIMNREETNCSSIVRACQEDPTLERCTVTINLGVPNNNDTSNINCESSVPDHCFVPYMPSQDYKNGTFVPSTDLDCRDVNVTDFRVTVRDGDNHNFDADFDLIGCESNS